MPNKRMFYRFDLPRNLKKTDLKHGPEWFSTLDLKYPYSQIPLDPETAKHCNLNIVGRYVTGTYMS